MQKSPKFKLARGYPSMVTLSSGNATKDVHPGQELIGEQWRRYVNLGILEEVQPPDQATVLRPVIPPPPISPVASQTVPTPVVVPADPDPVAEVPAREGDTSPAEPVAETDALVPQEPFPEVLDFPDPVAEPEPMMDDAPTFVEPAETETRLVFLLKPALDFVLEEPLRADELVPMPLAVAPIPEPEPEPEPPKPDERYSPPVSPSKPRRGRPRKQR